MLNYPLKSLQFTVYFSLALFFFIVKSSEAAEKPHEHGVGHITIAIEGSNVEVELTLPGADAVGFEHAPSSNKEKKAVSMAVKTLRDVKRIINFPAPANCLLEDAKIKSDLLENS